MKKFFVYISLAIMLLSNVSCSLLHVTLAVIAAPMNRNETMQRRILDNAIEASSSANSTQKLYSSKEFSIQYQDCIIQEYTGYMNKHDNDITWSYIGNNGKAIKEEKRLSVVLGQLMNIEDLYRNTPEKASPYNYAEFVEFLKNNDEMYKKYPIETMNVLQDWVKMQYEQCGVNVYTMEERCAAMKAVDIETEWCKK